MRQLLAIILLFAIFYIPAYSANLGAGDTELDVSSKFQAAANSLFDITGDITMEGWFRFESTAAQKWLMGVHAQADTRRGYQFLLGASSLCLKTSANPSSSNNDCGGSFTPLANRWYHLAVTQSGTSITFYIDCVQNGTATRSNAFNGNNEPFVIGGAPTDDAPYDGLVDDARLWSVARTAAQIASSCRRELPPNDRTSLVGEWRLNRNLLDNGPNKLNLTRVNNALLIHSVPFNWHPLNFFSF